MKQNKSKTGFKEINYIFRSNDLIPQDWKIKKIGSFSTEINQQLSEEPNPVIFSISKKKGFVKSSDYFNKQVFSKNVEKYKLVKKDNFAYSTIHIDEGAIALLKNYEKGYISPMYTVFEIDSTIEKEFLLYLMKSRRFLYLYSSMGNGSVERRKSVKFDILKQLKIPVPNKNEQKKIVTIITSIEQIQQKLDRLISEIQILKENLLQKLMKTGLNHTQFTKIDWYFKKTIKIPREWEDTTTLEIICKPITKGTTPSSYCEKERGIPFVKIQNIDDEGDIDTNDCDFIEKETHDKLSRSKLFENDILLTIAGTLGYIGLVQKKNIPSNTNQAISIIRLKNNIDFDHHFLFYFLKSNFVKEQIHVEGTDNNQPNLSLTQIKNLIILKPPLPEQKKIATILGNIDEQIRNVKKQKLNFINLKKELIEQLVTGQIRVNI